MESHLLVLEWGAQRLGFCANVHLGKFGVFRRMGHFVGVVYQRIGVHSVVSGTCMASFGFSYLDLGEVRLSCVSGSPSSTYLTFCQAIGLLLSRVGRACKVGAGLS